MSVQQSVLQKRREELAVVYREEGGGAGGSEEAPADPAMLSGAAYLDRLTEGFDKFALMAENKQIRPWRPKESSKYPKALAKGAKEQKKAEDWLELIRASLDGKAMPERQQVKPLNEVMSQLRGQQLYKAEAVIRQGKKLEEEEAELAACEKSLAQMVALAKMEWKAAAVKKALVDARTSS